MFLASVNVILELNPDLPFCGLVTDERVPQELVSVGSLVVVLDENAVDEGVEFLAPLLAVLEGRRRVVVDIRGRSVAAPRVAETD